MPGRPRYSRSTLSRTSGGTCPADGTGPGASHGFLLDWTNPGAAATAQENVVSYLLGGRVSPTPVVVP